MKVLSYVIPLIILFVIPGTLAVGAVFSYRKHRTIFHCLVCLLVLWLGILIGMGIKSKLNYKQHVASMAHSASELMRSMTLIREGEVERGINALDGRINSKSTFVRKSSRCHKQNQKRKVNTESISVGPNKMRICRTSSLTLSYRLFYSSFAPSNLTINIFPVPLLMPNRSPLVQPER